MSGVSTLGYKFLLTQQDGFGAVIGRVSQIDYDFVIIRAKKIQWRVGPLDFSLAQLGLGTGC